MVKKEVDVAQKKLVVRPTIRDILGMITWPLAGKGRRNINSHDFISCRYGDSPTIRSHMERNLTEENGLKVLAYSVGRIVAYVAYESRKTIYSYAISAPASGEGWDNYHARQIPLGDCVANIEDMISEGFKGAVYTNPLVRKRKLMGKRLGTIVLWRKQGLKYDYSQNKQIIPDGFDVLDLKEDCQMYWVHQFKGNDIRVYDTEFPASNRSTVYVGHYERFFTAIDEGDFPKFIDELRPKLDSALKENAKQSKENRVALYRENHEFKVVSWNVPAEIVKTMKRKALLTSL